MTNGTSRAGCTPAKLFFVQPIVYRSHLAALSATMRFTPGASPYTGIADLITVNATDGDVIGVLLGVLHWDEAGVMFVERAPPSQLSVVSALAVIQCSLLTG